MFPSNNPLTLTKVINALSNSINVINRALPIYEQAKPLISKSHEFIKKYNNKQIIKNKSSNKLNINQIKTTTLKSNSYNNPSFFK